MPGWVWWVGAQGAFCEVARLLAGEPVEERRLFFPSRGSVFPSFLDPSFSLLACLSVCACMHAVMLTPSVVCQFKQACLHFTTVRKRRKEKEKKRRSGEMKNGLSTLSPSSSACEETFSFSGILFHLPLFFRVFCLSTFLVRCGTLCGTGRPVVLFVSAFVRRFLLAPSPPPDAKRMRSRRMLNRVLAGRRRRIRRSCLFLTAVLLSFSPRRMICAGCFILSGWGEQDR